MMELEHLLKSECGLWIAFAADLLLLAVIGLLIFGMEQGMEMLQSRWTTTAESTDEGSPARRISWIDDDCRQIDSPRRS